MVRALCHYILSIVLLMCLAAWPAKVLAGPEHTPLSLLQNQDNTQKLAAGEVLIKVEKIVDMHGKSAHIQSAVQINATPEQVWTVLTDCVRAPSYVPGLKKCEILEQAVDQSWDIRRHTNKPAALLPTIISEFKCDYVYPQSVSFEGVGGDMDANSGAWHLRPTKDGTATIVTYRATVRAKTILPDKMLRKIMKKNIPKVMHALRKEVMADNAARPGTDNSER